ncbi:MAG: STAS/SEC14 domain-containing protein [Desulfomonile tiedjei]|nr:STAS/SEC14 domain-containing protein [Desulfomonile tiedjei]
MIEILPESEGSTLAIRGRGRLTAADYENLLIPRLEAILQQHAKARLLFDMDDDFKGWEFRAAWDYAKFGLKHTDHFEKVAAVCGPKWVQWGMKFKSLFVPGEVKTFSCAERPEALEWIRS